MNAAPPDALGLHGLAGNVSEWCADVYADYALPAAPGRGDRWARGTEQVVRGPSFRSGDDEARVSYRGGAGERGPEVGLRAARALER